MTDRKTPSVPSVLERLRELETKASRAPWKAEPYKRAHGCPTHIVWASTGDNCKGREVLESVGEMEPCPESGENAALIALLRNAAPALLKCVEALEEAQHALRLSDSCQDEIDAAKEKVDAALRELEREE